MTKTINLFILGLITFQFTFSQSIEFGKVSRQELLEKSYPNDSSASAAVLYKNQKTYFYSTTSTFELITEIHERIKLYNKDGFDKATVELNLYKSGATKERISKLKAYTFNVENGKTEKTELEKDQIFKSEYSDNYNQVKFTMPNVKEGAVLDIKYKIISPFFFNIDEFRFQYDIPVKKIVAEIRTPDGVNFNAKPKGYISFFPKHSKKRDLRIGMAVDILNYSLENVPALKEESFVNNINNYRAGVTFELTSILIPGQKPRYYSKSWSDVAKTIGNTDDYKNQLDKTNSFDDSLDNLIVSNADGIENMKSIFKYVKENLKWNGLEGKYFQKGIRKTLKEKKGNAADINLTLVAMLRYAGLDANPLIISTKDNMVPYFPTVDGLNYVIAYVVINQKPYFLDATEEFSDINMLPLKDYNWKGILVDNNKMVWKNVGIKEPPVGVSQYMINTSLDEEGVLEGNLKSRHTNHSAYSFREKFKKQDIDTYITKTEENFENIEISNYNAENTNIYEGYVSESFDFYKESAADIIDGKIYITPSLFLKISENPFKLDKREFPIDFGYPIKERYMVSMTFPDNYVVESSPEPIILKLPEDLGVFQFSPKVIGNKINLTISMELTKSMMGPETYTYLKEFFNQIINKEKEQIILTKAQP